MSERRPRRATSTTRIGTALEAERVIRGLTQMEAAAVLGIPQTTWSSFATGRTLPRLDPRTLASFLHHDDGEEWSIGEVLDMLAKDRETRRKAN